MEANELEDELSPFIIGKMVQVTGTNFKGEAYEETDIIYRLAVDTATKDQDILILFTNNGKRLEVNLDDFKTNVKILN